MKLTTRDWAVAVIGGLLLLPWFYLILFVLLAL